MVHFSSIFQFLWQRVYLFCLIILFSGFCSISEAQTTAKQIIDNMNAGIERVQTLKFKLKKKERVKGKMTFGEQECKYNRKPKKIYTKMISPKAGVEVLFEEGKNDNHAIVNPNGFPYVSLTLDPYGSTMRNNNHHTLHEVGFDYINSIVNFIEKKTGSDFDKYFLYTGDTVFNNRKCYKILIDYHPFGLVNYTVKEGEDLADIAYKLFVSDFMILDLNPGIDDYSDVKPGQVIKVPNGYARKTFLCIDKENYLPIVQMMYDEKGLFAVYEFWNLQLNPKIAPEEFTKEYKDYNF